MNLPTTGANLETLTVTRRSHDLPPGLITAAELSPLIGVAADRIAELADAGYWPHYRVEAGPPLFQKTESRRWVAENMLQRFEGRPLPANFQVIVYQPRDLQCVPPLPLAALTGLSEITDLILPPGIYFLCRDGEVRYVGQSVNVAGRLIQHRTARRFQRAYFLPVPPSLLDAAEAFFIEAIHPPENGNRGSTGALRPEVREELARQFLVLNAPGQDAVTTRTAERL